jgi:hypothetical protein
MQVNHPVVGCFPLHFILLVFSLISIGIGVAALTNIKAFGDNNCGNIYEWCIFTELFMIIGVVICGIDMKRAIENKLLINKYPLYYAYIGFLMCAIWGFLSLLKFDNCISYYKINYFMLQWFYKYMLYSFFSSFVLWSMYQFYVCISNRVLEQYEPVRTITVNKN